MQGTRGRGGATGGGGGGGGYRASGRNTTIATAVGRHGAGEG